MTPPTSARLSQVDAFFVAYQERARVPMQLGADITLRAELPRRVIAEAIEASLDAALVRWPGLGQRLRSPGLGLKWSGAPDRAAMLRTEGDPQTWRNTPIDPFREPPFQLLWLADGGQHLLCFRAHHAACDGQAFFNLCVTLTARIAGLAAGSSEPPWTLAQAPRPLRRLRERARVRGPRSLLRLIAVALRADREQRAARAGRTAKLALASDAQGPVAVTERYLRAEEQAAVFARARSLRVSTAALVAAAWARVLAEHNRRRGRDARPVSLEVPVSSRRGSERDDLLGNHISPLILDVVPGARLDDDARALARQLRDGVRTGAHLAVPLLTWPAAYLPWPLLRRLAASEAISGFATGHVVWLDGHHTDAHARVAASSGGAVELGNIRITTPVCRHMGAALLAIPWPSGLQVSVTYRQPALDAATVNTLLDRLRNELTTLAPDATLHADVARAGG